jgi:hypothetical protein
VSFWQIDCLPVIDRARLAALVAGSGVPRRQGSLLAPHQSGKLILHVADTAGVNLFPGALNSADSLGRAANAAVTRLLGGIGPDATSFAVENGDLLTATGLAVLQRFEPVEVEGLPTLLPVGPAEVIAFERVDDQLVNVLRGREGTAARAWESGDHVGMNPTAGLWDARAAAQMAVEAKLGAGASLPAPGTVLRGVAGGSAWQERTFRHVQNVAAAVWIITHNLHCRPAVTVVDSAGTVVHGEVVYDSDNQLTLSFSVPFGGAAYLN